ncbi:DUF4422 domain-containing protein [Lentilactobacillus buchneri]|uniref:DUF4422 domain-containing protein n=1 Tax=Lentilactobacillus buchneri TaxID=1581 RepID=UPI0012928FD9|nr:DUF4422 domain-containing protein [Lentilactobacillus buchneri]MQM61642.1 DUF4422 domain-containing protein [Lentilactobacillus buchneri]
MKTKILVAAHKKFQMPRNQKLYFPILVGAIYNYKQGINYQRDDEGVNISKKNPSYSELTAIYWAWKNLKNIDAIGLVHYRRYFIKRWHFSKIDNVIDEKDVAKLLSKYDVILPKKRHYYIETIYSHYVHSHHKEPLDATRRTIIKLYPSYLSSFDKVMSRRSAHMFNMFIMKRQYFNEYCKWLFDILMDVDNSININDYSKQEKRVFGYLSEVLMDVWIKKNKIVHKDISWKFIGTQHILKKVFFLFLRKFKIGPKQTHF